MADTDTESLKLLQELTAIGIALSAEKDHKRLLAAYAQCSDD